jgi:hypothetical protein
MIALYAPAEPVLPAKRAEPPQLTPARDKGTRKCMLSPRPWLAIALLSLQTGCASSAPQTQTPPPVATAAEAAPGASAPASPAGFFQASIVTVQLSMEDPNLRRVRVEFRNGTNRACKVTGYLVEWPGGKKPARPDVEVPPKQSRDRWLRIDKADGDLSALTAESAKVTLQSDCPVKSP